MIPTSNLIQVSKDEYSNNMFYELPTVPYEDLEVLFYLYDCDNCSSLFSVFRTSEGLRVVNVRRRDWDSFQQIDMLELSESFEARAWVDDAIKRGTSNGYNYPPAISNNLVLFVFYYCAKFISTGGTPSNKEINKF